MLKWNHYWILKVCIQLELIKQICITSSNNVCDQKEEFIKKDKTVFESIGEIPGTHKITLGN